MIRMQNHVPGQTHFGFVFQPLSIFPVISLIMVIDDGIVTTLDLYTSSANSLSHLSTAMCKLIANLQSIGRFIRLGNMYFVTLLISYNQ